jgi:hypothetical protein
VFVAREVLAKHDENYMPPEAAEALKQAQKGNPSSPRRSRPSRSGSERMIPELGHFLLWIALGVSAVLGAVPLSAPRATAATGWRWPGRRRRSCSRSSPSPSSASPLAFVGNDFSVLYVATNSNRSLPTHYRFAAVWGGHEGSMLLWTLMLRSGRSRSPASARTCPTR